MNGLLELLGCPGTLMGVNWTGVRLTPIDVQ
jgi:hypothetical protein